VPRDSKSTRIIQRKIGRRVGIVISLCLLVAAAVTFGVLWSARGGDEENPGDEPKPPAPSVQADAKRACSVYCGGTILERVQMLDIFPNDSKTVSTFPTPHSRLSLEEPD
jgi:hypothetical protein